MNALELSRSSRAIAPPPMDSAERVTRVTAATAKPYDTTRPVKKNSRVNPWAVAQHQHPERMRVGLHAFARVEDRAVSMEEVPHDPVGDVGIIANPGVGEKDVAERRDEERAGDALLGNLSERGRPAGVR